MIYEHEKFFLNCIPKTASKSFGKWCNLNGMHHSTDITNSKPMFAVYREPRERIISGIAEDLYYITVCKYQLNVVDDLSGYMTQFEEDVKIWLENPHHPIASDQCHYSDLLAYFPKHIDLHNVQWVHMNDILSVHDIIGNVVGIELTAIPADQMNTTTSRPPKSWYWELIKTSPMVTSWVNQQVAQDFTPSTFVVSNLFVSA